MMACMVVESMEDDHVDDNDVQGQIQIALAKELKEDIRSHLEDMFG